MTKHWQKDANAILIFVRDHVAILSSMYTNCNTTDRSILCCCFGATCRVRPRHKTQPSGQLRCDILSRKHQSDSRQLKHHCTTHIHSFHSHYTCPILPSEVRHLGEFTVVVEPGDQYDGCYLGNIITSMVTSIHQTHPAVTIQPGGASTIACVF